jgi:hypothetical protein
MSWAELTSRLIARVTALRFQDWLGNPGRDFRDTTNMLSQLDEPLVPPIVDEMIELGRRKIDGLANKEYAEAAKTFAEAEDRKIDVELKRRSMEMKIRQEEADTRLKELAVIGAEVDLYKKLVEIGVTIRRESDGTLIIKSHSPKPPTVSIPAEERLSNPAECNENDPNPQ